MTAPTASPAGARAVPPRLVAPQPAVAGALLLGVAAAVLLPGGPPGLGVVVLAALAAAVLVALRPGGAPRSRWQAVHAAAALLLAAAAAVRDAPWLVAPDLLAAAPLVALALVPARTWPGVLAAPARLLVRTPPAAAWLARGLRPLARPGGSLGPVVRGLALTTGLLAVFVPLLTSADARFAALVGHLGDLPGTAGLPARAVVLVVGAVAAAAALRTLLAPPADPVVPPATRVLRRASEWLLPLGALDVLLAAFLALQAGSGPDAAAGYADQLHAGFFQLVAVTALVLAVVAAAARWTPSTAGVRATLGVLCALTLVVDASALSRLHAYTSAYGLTRLRVGVGVTSLALAAVLAVLLAAGCRRGPQPWVAHAVVLVGAVALLATTAADPDAAIARSGVARGAAADTAYLSTLSADAVPALLALDVPQRDCVLALVSSRLGLVPGGQRPGAGWTSANLARARAAALLAEQPVEPCPGP